MTWVASVFAGLNVASLCAGFALGIVFGGKVRGLLASVLEKVAAFIR